VIAMLAFATVAMSAAPPPPSPAAAALAAEAHASIGVARVAPEAEIAAGLERQLLNSAAAWRGPPCDKTDPKCIAAAKQVAAEFAPRMAAYGQARANYLAATSMDARMSPSDMKAAKAFLETSAGRHLMDAFNDLSDPQRMSAVLAAVTFEGAGPLPPDTKTLYLDRFYDLTASLPRTTHMMVVPPPPQASRSPKP
jgi:hypothetical protein